MIYAVNRKTKEHRVVVSNAFVCEEEWYRENEWRIIQADADGWIEWSGGKCPLPGDCKTEYRMRGESGSAISRNGAQLLRWENVGDRADIIAYRPILEDKPQAPEDCVTVRYDLNSASVEGAIRDKLIEMGWTPPKDKPQTTEWNGEGLPPVGTRCEIQMTSAFWIEAQIEAYGRKHVLFIDSAEEERVEYIHAANFRPIRTDREKWIEAAIDAHAREVEAIYDALLSGELPMPKTDNRH